MTFQKAERKRVKLRLGICGTSGSGKTYSSLLIAKGLGGKIAVVDTENHSAELYAGKEGIPEYDVCVLTPPYETEKYVQAIIESERAGYDVIILDSISHAWAGEGGLLDQQGKIADSGRGNSYTAWRTVTPKHTKFIEKMLSCNLHLIATMRSKTEYALVTNEKGKQEPKKMGMAPIQREGMDYEFTVVFDVDQNHNATSSKDRTGIFDGKIFTPTANTGIDLKAWLESGIEPPKKDDVSDFKDPGDISDRFTKNDKSASQKSQDQQTTTGPGKDTTEKTQAEKNRIRLEIQISDAKLDRERVKEYLLHVAWLPIPGDGEKLSMNNLPDDKVGILLKPNNWKQFVAGYEKWMTEQK